MPSVNMPIDRNPNPQYSTNPEMARMIDQNPVFASLAAEVAHEREVSAMRQPFVYTLSGSVDSQSTQTFTILIEQGASFKCMQLTGSCFNFDKVVPTDFPMQNSAGMEYWASQGLSFDITDTRSGRKLTSGLTAAETLLTPGYGTAFIKPLDFRYYCYPNTKLRFDVRNRDGAPPNTARAPHQFNISLIGYKIYTPE
jgi:hypothetical protein